MEEIKGGKLKLWLDNLTKLLGDQAYFCGKEVVLLSDYCKSAGDLRRPDARLCHSDGGEVLWIRVHGTVPEASSTEKSCRVSARHQGIRRSAKRHSHLTDRREFILLLQCLK